MTFEFSRALAALGLFISRPIACQETYDDYIVLAPEADRQMPLSFCRKFRNPVYILNSDQSLCNRYCKLLFYVPYGQVFSNELCEFHIFIDILVFFFPHALFACSE